MSQPANEVKEIQPEFRITGKQPELWNAIDGSIRPLPAYEQKSKTTVVPMKLAPYESAFVVFRNKSVSSPSMNLSDNYPEEEVVEELQGPWEVQFDPSRRGPSEPVTFQTLQDWTASSDERVKYYSGEATYVIPFTLPERQEGETIWLDLGRLTSMAKVHVNGTYAGGAWTLQGEHHRPGTSGEENQLVTVVNNWMNRVIGDLNLPKAKRETWCLVNPYNENSPLQPSGLFGPVKLIRSSRKSTINP